MGATIGLAPPNRTSADGTYGGEVSKVKNRDGEVSKDPHDS